MNELWFVVSPQNPFKKNHSLLPEIHRLAMVNRSIEDDFRFKSSNIEFGLPKPSYTSDTLAHLIEKYPDYKFLFCGSNSKFDGFSKREILENYKKSYPENISIFESLPHNDLFLLVGTIPRRSISAIINMKLFINKIP